jgi:hypothetical protein
MSDEEPPFEVRAAAESLADGPILRVLAGGVVLVVVSLVVVHLMLGPRRAIPSELAGEVPREISRIDQTLVETDRGFEDERELQRRRLGSYGWIERDRGVLHIPIERAFDVMLEGPR